MKSFFGRCDESIGALDSFFLAKHIQPFLTLIL